MLTTTPSIPKPNTPKNIDAKVIAYINLSFEVIFSCSIFLFLS